MATPHYKTLDQCVDHEASNFTTVKATGMYSWESVSTDRVQAREYCETRYPRLKGEDYDEFIAALPTPAATPVPASIDFSAEMRNLGEPDPIPVRIVNPEALTQTSVQDNLRDYVGQTTAYVQQPEPIAPAPQSNDPWGFIPDGTVIPVGLIAVLTIGVIRGIVRRARS
jgi:hypothetical protein